jgi:hypothetical protein
MNGVQLPLDFDARPETVSVDMQVATKPQPLRAVDMQRALLANEPETDPIRPKTPRETAASGSPRSPFPPARRAPGIFFTLKVFISLLIFTPLLSITYAHIARQSEKTEFAKPQTVL